MEPLRKLSIHVSKYLSFSVLLMIFSFITFPILTRILSVSDYGLFSLANTTLLVVTALLKFGLSTAFGKEYAVYRNQNPNILYSTSFWLQVVTSAGILPLYALLISYSSPWVGEIEIHLLLVIIPLLFLRPLETLLLGFYRAEEKVGSFNKAQLVLKLGVTVSGIAGALLIKNRILGFFLGTIVVESGITLYLVLQRWWNIRIKDCSIPLGRVLFKYGAPLVIFELSSLVIAYVDRYQITYYLGPTALGIYSVGYNLATYAIELITTPLWMAIFPIYTKLWQDEGAEKTQEFLSSCLKYYFLLAIPILFGVLATGKDLIVLLASDKYVGAGTILPFVLLGLIINGMYHTVAAGLYLQGETKSVAYATVICAVINFSLNLFLIPKFGIMGAAYSTLIAYILLIIMIMKRAFRFLPLRVPFKDILFYTIFSMVMMILIRVPVFSSLAPRLAFMILLGTLCYGIMILVYDKQLRSMTLRVIARKS